jgi:diguanylate cyclase (GGDEF)-like protein
MALVRPQSKAPYADEDKNFLQIVANRAALVIENARLYAAETQRAGELDALHRATAALLTTIELDLLLGRILDIAESAVPVADQALLHLAVSDQGERQFQGTDNLHDVRLKTIRLPLSQSFSVAALREKFPLLIADLKTQPDLSGTCFSEIGLPAEFHGSGSAMVAPLILNEELLGLLSLTSSSMAAFDEADQRLLMSFANTTTTALRNAMLHAKVQQLAITDSLTEIYNRRGFFDLGRREIDRALRFGRPLSAIMIDIDGFKEVNDTFGHTVGDQVLRIIAERLRTSVREVDILGRYGGDEFVILLPETEPHSAVAAAERIRIHLAEPVGIHQIQPENFEVSEPLSITASLGVGSLEGRRMELAALLAKADAGAYLAKQRGRNRVEVL